MKLSRKFLGAAAGVLVLATAGAGQAATLIGATRIEITSAVPDWINIAEVEAFEVGTGDNVASAALGGTASAVSSGFGGTPSGAIDGDDSSAFGLHFYHSGGTGPGEKLTISFGAASDLASLRIAGRSDCCRGRDFWNVTIFNAANETLFDGQLDARTSATFDAIAAFEENTGAIPEPSTWAMMILGFGAVGAMVRSRRRVALG